MIGNMMGYEYDIAGFAGCTDPIIKFYPETLSEQGKN
jgi:hypothetical protein